VRPGRRGEAVERHACLQISDASHLRRSFKKSTALRLVGLPPFFTVNTHICCDPIYSCCCCPIVVVRFRSHSLLPRDMADAFVSFTGDVEEQFTNTWSTLDCPV
jgi:hypothetical protein